MSVTILDSVWFTEMRLESVWFTEMSPKPIGIVLINDGLEDRAYIGTGNGVSQQLDEELITEKGANFPVEVAKKLMSEYSPPYQR